MELTDLELTDLEHAALEHRRIARLVDTRQSKKLIRRIKEIYSAAGWLDKSAVGFEKTISG